MYDPILTNPCEREILEGSLELVPDTENLHDSIRAVLRNRPSVAQVSRVIDHLRTDDFDYMSGFAEDARINLEAYRETLYLET